MPYLPISIENSSKRQQSYILPTISQKDNSTPISLTNNSQQVSPSELPPKLSNKKNSGKRCLIIGIIAAFLTIIVIVTIILIAVFGNYFCYRK